MRHFLIVAILVLVGTALSYGGLNLVGLLPQQASAQAVPIDWLFHLEIILICFLFSLIIAPLGYSLVVFRRKKGETGEGAYITGNTRLEIAWTLAPLVIVLILAYLGAYTLGETRRVDPEALEVNVTAFQWAWRYEYPELGLTTSELVLPEGKQALLKMESPDVIHSFWVPEFRVKQDIVPGIVTQLRITPSLRGDFKVRCAELCGASHAYMEGPVRVVTEVEFQEWVAAQQAGAVTTGGEPDPENGYKIAQENGCQACHSLDGSTLVGPSWKGLYGSKVTLEDGSTVTADDAFITESILDPRATVVAGFVPSMPPYKFSESQIVDLIAFIKTLER